MHNRVTSIQCYFVYIYNISLPDEVITANSIGCFKSKLDKYWGQIGHGYEQRLTSSLLLANYLTFCFAFPYTNTNIYTECVI